MPIPKKYTNSLGDKADWQEVMYMAATIYGEARGEEFPAKCDVGWVIRNRAELGGWYSSGEKDSTIKAVCTKPWQFSCWNHNDPNYKAVSDIALGWRSKPDMLLSNHITQECIAAALLVLNGKVKDRTLGATHYHTKAIAPDWSKGKEPVHKAGHHVFYNGID